MEQRFCIPPSRAINCLDSVFPFYHKGLESSSSTYLSGKLYCITSTLKHQWPILHLIIIERGIIVCLHLKNSKFWHHYVSPTRLAIGHKPCVGGRQNGCGFLHTSFPVTVVSSKSPLLASVYTCAIAIQPGIQKCQGWSLIRIISICDLPPTMSFDRQYCRTLLAHPSGCHSNTALPSIMSNTSASSLF